MKLKMRIGPITGRQQLCGSDDDYLAVNRGDGLSFDESYVAKEDVPELVQRLQAWLDTGSLRIAGDE